jgi:hypothetical protein
MPKAPLDHGIGGPFLFEMVVAAELMDRNLPNAAALISGEG